MPSPESSPTYRRALPPARRPAFVIAVLLLFAVRTDRAVAADGARGEIRVTVRAEDGRELDPVVLELLPQNPGVGRTHVRARTDVQGVARFTGLRPGSYTVRLYDVPWPFVAPRDSPYQPPGVVTLRPEDVRPLELELTLQAGVAVEVGVDGGVPTAAGFVARFLHRASGREVAMAFEERSPNPLEKLLVPGAWDVSIDPLPGYLLTGVTRDGEELPGHVVSLDLVQNPFPTSLRFTYRAPATAGGVVLDRDGGPVAVEVTARLVEPGPWIAAARRRGGSQYQQVTTRTNPRDGTYEMVLPDGLWRVAPESESLVASEPPFTEVALGPDQHAQLDFTVEREEGSEGAFLVLVLGRDGAPLRGAQVEVSALGSEREVLRSGKTGASGRVGLDGLPKRSYLLAAAHRDYLETRLELHDFDSAKTRLVSITLREGSTIRLLALDGDGRPLPGIDLAVERQDALPPLLIEEAELTAPLRRVATDSVGRAEVRGLYPGLHHVRAVRPEARGKAAELFIGRSDTEERQEVPILLQEAETVDLVARQPPSTRLALELVCSDDGVLPDAASVRLYEAGVVFEESAGDGEAVLAVDDVPLLGKTKSVLRFGPVPRGAYRLAVRPAGFSRWTWAFEAYAVERSSEVQVFIDEDGGDTDGEDLGIFKVECGPAVDVVVAVATGQELPSPGPELVVRLFEADGEREIARTPSVTKNGQRYEVRALREGPVILDLVLSHPCLLPYPTLRWQLRQELLRGGHVEVAPLVEAIGGAVRLVAPASGWARLRGVAGELWETALEDGTALFPSLQPGVYRAELCADRTCGEIVRSWDGVEVTAGSVVELIRSGT